MIPRFTVSRDVIGIAKTGSGKTLAFALPLLRHVSDQPPVIDGSEGPVALILAEKCKNWRRARKSSRRK